MRVWLIFHFLGQTILIWSFSANATTGKFKPDIVKMRSREELSCATRLQVSAYRQISELEVGDVVGDYGLPKRTSLLVVEEPQPRSSGDPDGPEVRTRVIGIRHVDLKSVLENPIPVMFGSGIRELAGYNEDQ